MRAVVSGLMTGLPFNARETVVCETPATLAMSLIVTGTRPPNGLADREKWFGRLRTRVRKYAKF